MLEKDCLNHALLAAVDGGNPANVGKLILRGATNIDEALSKSRKLKEHAVAAALLIIKAAMENDKILVLKLYGENVQGQQTKIPLTAEDDLGKLQAAVSSSNFKTVIPIELSRRHNASAVREELLLRKDVDKSNGTVLWFGLRLMQLEISWLRKIYWVQTLKLARNEFTSVPPEMGNHLKQCVKLDLQRNKLRDIPRSLLELPSIKELNLSHNDLVNIPDVPEWSASLVVLDLSNNHLSNLPNSAVASALKNLNISDNRFRVVPHCVCSFIRLTVLNIANNSEIVALPSELGRLKNLLILNLNGLNDLNDPPKSVRGSTGDCIRYLNSRLRGARGYYRMKLMLVGKQAMGKTTLVARLHNREVGNDSTIGVDVSEWKYTPAYNKRSFHFSIWDFAGQEEYYATHQCFLSNHSLYLLVWNVTEGEAGVADLKPWLNNISVRAPNSCVIVVGTFLDQVSEEDRQAGKLQNLLEKINELTEQYHNLNIYKITVVGLKGRRENVNKLKDYIYNAAADYKVKDQFVMGKLIPSSYHALDAKLSTIHRLVKERKHEPIMHTAEFENMVKDLKLVDIQDDDELHTVTRFLHEVGSLLHYDDRKHNLDDLYFVDPRWLCDLMSTIVTVKERNPFVKQGILRSKDIPVLFKDKRFPYKYFSQYLTLLNRFEIALPLDKDYKRVLIPSMLPEKCPGDVVQQQPDYKTCYKRFILFRRTIDGMYCPTPPGLWSRLLSRIMNTVKEVRNILSDQVPVEDSDVIIPTNIRFANKRMNNLDSVSINLLDRFAGNSVTSETCSIYSTAFEDPLESIVPLPVASESLSSNSSHKESRSRSVPSKGGSISNTAIDHNSMAAETCSVYSNVFEDTLESTLSSPASSVAPANEAQPPHRGSHSKSLEELPTVGDRKLVYWCTGLVYHVDKLSFSIESLSKNIRYRDKDGILILASQGVEGRKMLGQLNDIVERLISEWYPGLELEQKVPCSECLKSSNLVPDEFNIKQLLPLIANHKVTHKCVAHHEVQLVEIVPDLLLADLDSAFRLDYKEVIYKQEEGNLLGTGACGEVYRGKYKNREVAIKLYAAKEGSDIEKGFKELRSESKVLQQLYHPCLMCMVGVTVNPKMSLVLELAPQGSLQSPLLKNQMGISRIVLHRIAIQVASALRFLHSINIIFRDLKADNVLLWSLSPDHLINCKVADFNIATHIDPGGITGLHGTKGFIAPEVSHVNHAKEHSVYDHRADIFSFGMFLYQLVARRHPFHNLEIFNIETAIEGGKRPQLEDVSIADIGLFYMARVMKHCWAGDPEKRPTCQQIIEWLSAPALQLIISVVPLNCRHSIRNGCIVTLDLNNETGPNPTSSELWICFDGKQGGELSVFTTNTMQELRKHSVMENQMQCIKQCGQYVWVPSRTDIEDGVVNIFNKTTKDLVHSLKMKENTVSCIMNSDDLVYLGTMEGNCLIFPIEVVDIQTNTWPYCQCVSEHCIDGLALGQTCLWASVGDEILFLDPQTLEWKGFEQRKKYKGAYIGNMMLSDNGKMMWSAHLGGIILSAWNAHECTHITDVDVNVCAEEKCHIDDRQNRIMTAMCVALDTVWVGLYSGYIMVFAMDQPGELLTYFRPYNNSIRFLSANKCPGPCQKEECMMLCGGKMYRPDDNFKELPDYAREDEKGKPVDTAGVAVLWEVLPAKYLRQVCYLSNGTSWLNYATLEIAMNDTGFTDSMQYCQSSSTNSPASATTTDGSHENIAAHQQ